MDEQNSISKPIVKQYEGNNISFFLGKNVMVNATEMAKPFGKRTADWLNNGYAKEFLKTLSEVRKRASADLVRVIKGGDPKMQGTWMHQDVALEFARWLSPKFAIWCNDRIKELLTTGSTSLSPWQIVTNALSVAQNQLAIYKDQLDQARAESADTYKLYKAQKEENTKLLPDANYTRETLTSKSTWNTNVVAKEFGLTAKTLNKKLKGLGIQYKQHGVWLLSSEYQDKGYTKTRTYPYINSKGETCSRLQTEWTEAGRKWLHELHDKKKF